MNCRSSEPSYSAQYFRTVVAPPDVVVDQVAISVQSEGVLGLGAVLAASTVAMIRSLLPLTSVAVVPVGSAGVTLVPVAVACDALR